MTRARRFARQSAACSEGSRCDCGDCAELDLDHPGEGIQLALPIHPVAHLARRREPQQETA